MPGLSTSTAGRSSKTKQPQWLETTFDILGGVNTLDNAAEIRQDPRDPTLGLEDPRYSVRMSTANNVYAPASRQDLTTRLGFTTVRSTAIGSDYAFTGFQDMGVIAAQFLISAASTNAAKHSIFKDTANPPVEITGGTNFTNAATNTITTLPFTDGTNPGIIFISRSQDLPQFVDATPTRSNFTISGTGLTSLKPSDAGEIFGQRALYGNYNQDGTVYEDRVAYTDIRNGKTITDITTQFYSFETSYKDKVRALKKFSDICLVGKLNNVFSLVITPSSSTPFRVQEEPGGRYKGPVSQQSMVEADQRVWWWGQSNIHSIDQNFKIVDWGDRIKPTIAGLSQSQMQYVVGGYDIVNDLVLWSVTDNNLTAANRVIAINIKTGELFFWSITRNAFGYRLVSGQPRLIGGGYVGLFYNETQSATYTGNLDDATALIDADVQTPRHHLNLPNYIKLFSGIKVTFSPQQTSESVTLQYRLDDNASWTSFGGSPYSVTGTDANMKYFALMKTGRYLQLRFRDANSGQAFRVTRYTIVWRPLYSALVF